MSNSPKHLRWPAPTAPPSAESASTGFMSSDGHAMECRQHRAWASYRRHSDRQSRRHHLARARDACGADLIACEDTRVTRKLLDRYAIATPLTPYHDHNAATARPKLLQRLAEGAAIALVSDAGTPLISDPGYKLVRAAQEAGHSGHRAPGRFRGSGRAHRCRLADRSILLRRVLAAKNGGAPRPHRRTGPHPGDFGVLRNRTADRGYACRPCRRIRRPRSGCVPRAHQTPRGGPARRSPGAGASRRNGRNPRRIRCRRGAAVGAAASADDADALLREALARVSLKDAVGEVAVATGVLAPGTCTSARWR